MHKRGSFKDQIKNAKTSPWWIQWLTWACTCQREIEVLPSYPGLNCKVTDRGPMFEMAKFVGGPGSSVLGEREKCVLVYKTLHFLFYLVLNINWNVKMFGCVMAPPFGKMRLCIQRNKYKINDHSYCESLSHYFTVFYNQWLLWHLGKPIDYYCEWWHTDCSKMVVACGICLYISMIVALQA